jgi:hypothetical protein
MKTRLLIALMAMTSFCTYAQTTENKTPELKNNGPEVFVRPHFDRPFKVLFDPPCIEYKRHGLVVLECPGIMMAPESGDYDKSMYRGYDNQPCGQVTTGNIKEPATNTKNLTKE